MLDQTEVQRGRTWYLRKVTPLSLTMVPDNWNNVASTSPVPMGTSGSAGIGAGALWRPADATHAWARTTFRCPAGTSPLTPLRVRGLIVGTATSETIIITCYKASWAAGDAAAFDTANSTEQASIAVAATYVVVTIATITPVAAGDVITLAFRPRTVADGNVTQFKGIESIWLEA